MTDIGNISSRIFNYSQKAVTCLTDILRQTVVSNMQKQDLCEKDVLKETSTSSKLSVFCSGSLCEFEDTAHYTGNIDEGIFTTAHTCGGFWTSAISTVLISLDNIFSKVQGQSTKLNIVLLFSLICLPHVKGEDQFQAYGLHALKYVNGSKIASGNVTDLVCGKNGSTILYKVTCEASVILHKRDVVGTIDYDLNFFLSHYQAVATLISMLYCLMKVKTETHRVIPCTVLISVSVVTTFYLSSQMKKMEDKDVNDMKNKTDKCVASTTSDRWLDGRLSWMIRTGMLCVSILVVLAVLIQATKVIESFRQDIKILNAMDRNPIISADTMPHSCPTCAEEQSENGFICVREKHKAKTHKPSNFDEIFCQSLDEPDIDQAFKKIVKLEDAKHFVEVHPSGSNKSYTPSPSEEIVSTKCAETSSENAFEDFEDTIIEVTEIENRQEIDSEGRDLATSISMKETVNLSTGDKMFNDTPDSHYVAEIIMTEKGMNDVNVLIPESSFNFGKCQPLSEAAFIEAENYQPHIQKKIRMQVVPNSSGQSNEKSDMKTVSKITRSRSWKMQKSNETFLNLNYKVQAEKFTNKKTDYTLKEEEFERLKLREITWLPITDLPVPVIDLTVAHITQFEPLMKIIDLIAAGTPPTPHISMRYELLRFCTLRSYPKEDKPFIIMLAEAGFYYASDGDGVVCYCCGVRRYNWTAEDIPGKVHERINPSCKFLRKNEEVNVPVQYFGPYSKELMAIMDIPEPVERPEVSEDVNNDWAPERVRAPESQNRPNQSGTNALGINTAIPKHSQYATKTAREASYTSWPDTSSHTPHDLADAGFFYAGFGDCVRCFYCGIGLRHWTSEDDAWIEHARWSRNCVFVKQKKGEEFINLVQMAVQYAQDNENNTSGQGPQQIQEIERLLLSDPAQSVLGMGYQPRIIKQAIENIMNQNASAKITSQLLMEKVLEIESSSNQPTATAAATPAATAKSEKAKPEVKKPEQGKKPAPKNNPEKKPEKSEPSNEGKDKDKGEEDDSQQDPKAIKKENEELKEQTLCKVCLDNTVSIVFLPCGHLVTCADCAPAMRKCPICRALVKGTVRTYMS